jgi:hypothetical protein
MATNRWYRNDTNTILDLTGADAADVENKANDIANGLDSLEVELDALIGSDEKSLKVSVAGESPSLTLIDTAIERANKVVGFNSTGDLVARVITSLEGLSFEFQVLTAGATLTLNTQTAYHLNLTPDVPPDPRDIDRTPIIDMSLPAVADAPIGSTIMFSTNDWAGFRVAKLSGSGQLIEGDAELIIDAANMVFRVVKVGATTWSVCR